MWLGVIDFSEKHANIGTLFWATVYLWMRPWWENKTILYSHQWTGCRYLHKESDLATFWSESEDAATHSLFCDIMNSEVECWSFYYTYMWLDLLHFYYVSHAISHFVSHNVSHIYFIRSSLYQHIPHMVIVLESCCHHYSILLMTSSDTIIVSYCTMITP